MSGFSGAGGSGPGTSGASGFSGFSGLGFSGPSGPSGTSGFSGPGGATRFEVAQVGHGFTTNQAIYRTTSGTWALAEADIAANSSVVGVVESTQPNSFVVVTHGLASLSGFSAGINYFLSTVAGDLSASDPNSINGSYVSKPVLVGIDASTAVVQVLRGLYGNASGFSGPSGTSGFSGTWSGQSGFSGALGQSGSSGSSGFSGVGISGFSGSSGYGASGFSGVSGAGTSGFSGSSGYSGVGISGFSGSGSSMTWIPKNNTYGANASEGILADTLTNGAWTLTLPSPPSVGNIVGVIDAAGGFSVNNLTISSNGYMISGLGADLICNKAFLSFDLVYVGGTVGWAIKPIAGSSIGALYGYFVGGSSGVIITTTDRVVFSTDVNATKTSADLPVARIQGAGVNGGLGGYSSGGYTLSNTCNLTDKLTYSTETTAAMATANLSSVRGAGAGLSNGATKGYVCGGLTDNVSGVNSVVADKITFSSDVASAQTTADMTVARAFPSSLSTATNGYMIGGYSNNSSVITVTAEKLVFSTDTTSANTVSDLATQCGGSANCPGFTKGYMLGGSSGTFVNSGIKLTYSSEVTSAVTTANLSSARYGSFGVGSYNDNKGYAAGGFTGAFVPVNTTDKVTFSTDVTVTQATANLTGIRTQGTSLTSQATVAWS